MFIFTHYFYRALKLPFPCNIRGLSLERNQQYVDRSCFDGTSDRCSFYGYGLPETQKTYQLTMALWSASRTRYIHEHQRLGVDVCSIQELVGSIFEHMLLKVFLFLSLFL